MKRYDAKPMFYLITVFYFALAFVNITLAITALVCMGLPFFLAYRDKKKTWCRVACPRADLLTRVGRIGRRKSPPSWLVGDNARRVVLGYFCLNLLFATMSTIAAATNRIDPINNIRFLMVLEFPWSPPQLFTFEFIPAWISHLSYRFYSIMLTSSLIGIGLALRYKPRTWCAICPVSSMTGNMLNNMDKIDSDSTAGSIAS